MWNVFWHFYPLFEDYIMKLSTKVHTRLLRIKFKTDSRSYYKLVCYCLHILKSNLCKILESDLNLILSNLVWTDFIKCEILEFPLPFLEICQKHFLNLLFNKCKIKSYLKLFIINSGSQLFLGIKIMGWSLPWVMSSLDTNLYLPCLPVFKRILSFW